MSMVSIGIAGIQTPGGGKMNRLLASRYANRIIRHLTEHVHHLLPEIEDEIYNNSLFLKMLCYPEIWDEITSMEGLQYIDVGESELTRIDRPPSTVLDLMASNNDISFWPTGLPKNLRILDLSNNNIHSVPDLSGLTNLRQLNLENNPIDPDTINLPESLDGHRVSDLFWYVSYTRPSK